MANTLTYTVIEGVLHKIENYEKPLTVMINEKKYVVKNSYELEQLYKVEEPKTTMGTEKIPIGYNTAKK